MTALRGVEKGTVVGMAFRGPYVKGLKQFCALMSGTKGGNKSNLMPYKVDIFSYGSQLSNSFFGAVVRLLVVAETSYTETGLPLGAGPPVRPGSTLLCRVC